jgi:hypothetical protein
MSIYAAFDAGLRRVGALPPLDDDLPIELD